MRRLGAQTAVVEHRGVRRFRTSYAALAQGAQWFASELTARGIAPGERVVLWGENSAAWIACFFGCVLRGVLVVPLDATGSKAFAQRIVGETTPRLIACDPARLASLLATPQEFCQVREFFDLARIDLAMRSPSRVRPTPAVALGPDTPLQILFTSGTTGQPKGIVHTHRNLLASLTPIEREIDKYRRYERWVHPLHFLHTLPLSHVFGQFMGLWIAPVLGAVVHYESRLEAGRLLRLLRRERISVLAAVPRVLELLRTELLSTHPGLPAELAQAESAHIWARWWRFRRIHRQLGFRFWAAVCGGATLPASLESFWNILGIALVQGYGMTETSALVTLNHPFKPARGTLGSPLPGRELRISDQGELLVRGEMVSIAIWQNGGLHTVASAEDEDRSQAESSPASGGGWLATGDLTRRDEQGRLHYLGRTSQRLVTSAGLNVYLEDVEAALAAQPGIEACAVVAVEGKLGPEPAAVLRAPAPAIASRAVVTANAELAAHQRVHHWWLWPELDLPRTSTGKIRRNLLESWAQARLENEREAPGVASGSTDPDPLLQLIAQSTGESELARTAQDQTSLESLGLDSLARVQLQTALEQARGQSLGDADFAAAQTLGDLRRLIGSATPLVAGATDDGQPGSNEPPIDHARLGFRKATRSTNTADPYKAGTDTARLQHSESSAATVPGERLLPALAPAASERSRTMAGTDNFLYPRWPWKAPTRQLRTLFIELVVRPLVWLLAAPRVLGRENLLPTNEPICPEPLLLVANHVSSYDLPLLLYALPAHLRRHLATAAAGEMLEDWRHARPTVFGPALLGPAIYWLLTILFNIFPLPRSHAFRRAFLHAGEALDQGLSVLIFPEGARSQGKAMQPFRGGIGLLAQQAGVQILPVALSQARNSKLPRSLRRRPSRPFHATICIGTPITIQPNEEPHAITAKLEQAVKALLAHADS